MKVIYTNVKKHNFLCEGIIIREVNSQYRIYQSERPRRDWQSRIHPLTLLNRDASDEKVM